MAESLIKGVYDVPNNASLAGQKWGEVGQLKRHDSTLAYLEGGQYFLGAFQGLGDAITLGTVSAGRPSVPGFAPVMVAEKVGVVNSAPVKTARASKEFVTLFLGDKPGTMIIKSYAAHEGGYLGSQRLISESNINDLFRAHAVDSKSPPSSYISLTTDRRVAEYFTGPNGVVNELRVPLSRAVPNSFNNFSVPAGPGGRLIPEAEYWVPNYIRPSEFVTWPPKH